MDQSPLFFFGIVLGWGFVNLVLASKLAEFRVDDISADGGMRNDPSSIGKRFTPSNYSPAGRRWLRWAIASFVAQLIVVLVWSFIFF